LVVSLLGILKAGGAYVPLEPGYPRERLAYMMADAGVPVLLTQTRFQEQLAQPVTGGLRVVSVDGEWAELARASAENPVRRIGVENLAYIIYTSGSTGRPKGVLIPHQNLFNSTRARLDYYDEPVKSFLLLSSFAFDSSVAGIFWTLCEGGALVLPRQDFERDPLSILETVNRHHVSSMLCLPSLYGFLLEQDSSAQLNSLRTVIVAGEVCPKDLVERHQVTLPGARLFNEYGPTEGTVWSTVYELRSVGDLMQVPIGRPIPGVQNYILDSTLEVVPVGVAGELHIGGAGISRGYWQHPSLTAARFVPDPFSAERGARMYKTGDLARHLADGNIDFLGRVDHQVKIRGFRIELGEIEAVLASHPAIREVVVIGREDQPGDQRLVAYLVCKEGDAPVSNDLRRFLREKLPEYMVPSAFVTLGAFPLTPNGKVDRRALPAPQLTRSDIETSFVAPGNELEMQLAEIWEELLKVEKVGVHDNFFDLGGHSFLTMKVHDRLQQKLQLQFPLLTLFEHSTIAALAQFLGNEQQAQNLNRQQPEEWAGKRRAALKRQRRAQRN
jgi:amino acid adenylation domain-containing protein